jgi:aspartyl-tRNA synthetase
MHRTHTCGELTAAAAGEDVTLCGWVDSRRDHGKLIFIDVRDRYGVTQVIFLPKPHTETYEKAKKLRNEDVVKITGKVNSRPKNTENPKIVTGLIEVCAEVLDIVGPSCDLPFTVEDGAELGEEIRLLHRYLDLRRPIMRDKLIMRHKGNQAFREYLNNQQFLEIETPFLTKSTPEGARDYLVPSRLNPGKLYALPQSPQLFKQILMVSGFDRYYQVVKCFRDEDLRKDRQPEFTQLDIELSFADEEDILTLIENMFAEVFSKVLGVTIKTPFLRMTYSQAMAEYGSDKPDVGEGDYRFLWVVDFPLFEYNEDEKRMQACHHPFTAPKVEDMPFLDSDPLKVRARAYDLVLNGQELGSGSVRIHSSALQEKIFDILGIEKEEAKRKFGFLLRAFQYGVPPHAGAAFGLDRLYAIITGSESIREVIAFPKTQRGTCLLSEAPSRINQKHLDELSIKITEPDE